MVSSVQDECGGTACCGRGACLLSYNSIWYRFVYVGWFSGGDRCFVWNKTHIAELCRDDECCQLPWKAAVQMFHSQLSMCGPSANSHSIIRDGSADVQPSHLLISLLLLQLLHMQCQQVAASAVSIDCKKIHPTYLASQHHISLRRARGWKSCRSKIANEMIHLDSG